VRLRFEFSGNAARTCAVKAYVLDGANGDALVHLDRFNPHNASKREAFCSRVAEILTKNGHEIAPDEVERAFLESLEAQAKQSEHTQSVQLPSVILPDGRVAEQVYDFASDKVAFVVGGPDCGTKILEQIKIGERTIVPVGGTKGDAFLQAGAVRLPSFQVAEVQPLRTAQVLAEVERFISRYVGLRPGDLTAVASYVLLTWLADKADAVPYLCFRGDYGTGKSRALQVVGVVCRRPAMISASPTPAVLFRLIEAWQPTLIIDELNQRAAVTDDITAILNAGYQRGATVLRCVGDEHEPQPFRCYGPKIIATRQTFGDDALESRLLVINMLGDKPDNIPTVLDRDTFERETQQLRDLLCAWRLRYWHEFDLTDPGIDLPDLDYRYVQIITPLLAVAPPVQRARLRDWFVEHVARQIEEQSDRWTARIARIVVEHFDDPQADLLPIADIRSTLEAEVEDGEKLDVPSAARIGRITKNLGLPKGREPVTRRMVIPPSEETRRTVRRLKRRYAPPRIDTAENLSILSNLSDENCNPRCDRNLSGQVGVTATTAILSENLSILSGDRKDRRNDRKDDRKDVPENLSGRKSLDNWGLGEKIERTERIERIEGKPTTLLDARQSGPHHPVDNSLADDQVVEVRPAKVGGFAEELGGVPWTKIQAAIAWNRRAGSVSGGRSARGP